MCLDLTLAFEGAEVDDSMNPLIRKSGLSLYGWLSPLPWLCQDATQSICKLQAMDPNGGAAYKGRLAYLEIWLASIVYNEEPRVTCIDTASTVKK